MFGIPLSTFLLVALASMKVGGNVDRCWSTGKESNYVKCPAGSNSCVIDLDIVNDAPVMEMATGSCTRSTAERDVMCVRERNRLTCRCSTASCNRPALIRPHLFFEPNPRSTTAASWMESNRIVLIICACLLGVCACVGAGFALKAWMRWRRRRAAVRLAAQTTADRNPATGPMNGPNNLRRAKQPSPVEKNRENMDRSEDVTSIQKGTTTRSVASGVSVGLMPTETACRPTETFQTESGHFDI